MANTDIPTGDDFLGVGGQSSSNPASGKSSNISGNMNGGSS